MGSTFNDRPVPFDTSYKKVTEKVTLCWSSKVLGRLRPGSGGIHGPKPYKFIRFGDIHGPKPYKFIGFGDMDVTRPYNFIGFGDIHGPKPYKLMGFGDIYVTQ